MSRKGASDPCDLYSDWRWEARLAVASLRFMSVTSPHDPDKNLMLPDWGTVELDYHVLHSPLDDGQRLLVHTAPEGTGGYDALRILCE